MWKKNPCPCAPCLPGASAVSERLARLAVFVHQGWCAAGALATPYRTPLAPRHGRGSRGARVPRLAGSHRRPNGTQPRFVFFCWEEAKALKAFDVWQTTALQRLAGDVKRLARAQLPQAAASLGPLDSRRRPPTLQAVGAGGVKPAPLPPGEGRGLGQQPQGRFCAKRPYRNGPKWPVLGGRRRRPVLS